MLETEYTPHIVARLNKANRGTRVHRQNAGTVTKRNERGRVQGAIHGAPAGAADLVGIATLLVGPVTIGTYLEVELKGHRTPWPQHQRDRKVLIERLGGIYTVCRYNERESLDENLDRHEAEVRAVIATYCERFQVLRDQWLEGQSVTFHSAIPFEIAVQPPDNDNESEEACA